MEITPDMVLKAFAQGLLDGLQSEGELSVGMTYPNSEQNEAYDHGVNIGLNQYIKKD